MAQFPDNNRISTTDTSFDGERAGLAVAGACTAFHARIAVDYLNALAVHFEDFMGADIYAHPAAIAFFGIVL